MKTIIERIRKVALHVRLWLEAPFMAMAIICTAPLMAAVSLAPSCTALKSVDANAICNNALLKQAVVIAAAAERSIPIEQYVDGLCKIASIAEPFIKAPLKPAVVGEVGAIDPIAEALAAARKEGLVK